VNRPIDVKEDTAPTVRVLSKTGFRFTAPTASFVNASGAEVEAPVATPDAVSTTVDTDPTNALDEVTLVSVAGVAVGRVYLLQTTTGPQLVEVDRIDTATRRVRFAERLNEIPADASAFQGIEVSVALTAAGTADRGTNFRLVVSEGVEVVTRIVYVCRQPFNGAITSHGVRRIVADTWRSHAILGSESKLRAVADAANAKIHNTLQSAERYAHLFLDGAAFEDAGTMAAQLVLLERYNLVPPGESRPDYRRALRFDLRDRLVEIVSSVSPYDKNDDGDVSVVESSIKSIKLRR